MDTVLEHAVTILKTLPVSEKRYTQYVASQYLDIHRSGFTLPPLTIDANAPPAERLHGLLSQMAQAELENFSATVASMLEEETSVSDLQEASTDPADEVPETQSHELRDESTEFATNDVIGVTSQRDLAQVQQDLSATDQLADVAVAEKSTSQPEEQDAPSGSEPSDIVLGQPGGPQSSDTGVTASPHSSDDENVSSSKAMTAPDATDKSHTQKRKATDESTPDGEVQSQPHLTRPTKSHKTGLHDFAGVTHAGPSNEHIQAPMPMGTKSSEESAPEVQNYNTTSTSPSSSASGITSDEPRRKSNVSQSTLATSTPSSDGNRSPGAYNFSSHDLFRKGNDPHAKRFDRGTPIPFNHQVHAFCLGNNNPDRLNNHGFSAWLQIHGFDKDWLKYNFSLGLVHQYAAGANGFQDGFYGPPNTRVTVAPPTATYGVQQNVTSYQKPSYGQQNHSALQLGAQSHGATPTSQMIYHAGLAQSSGQNKTKAKDVPPCTLEEIVRCVQNGRPKELKNDALKNFLRDYAPDMYKKSGENKASLLKKALNTGDVRRALQNVGLQVPIEYRVNGLAPIYNATSIGQTSTAMPTHDSHNSVGSSMAYQAFGAQEFDGQNNWEAQDYQQSRSTSRSSRGSRSVLSNGSTKATASNVGGSMASRVGINKTQAQSRPSYIQRDPSSFLQAYAHQQSRGNFQFSNMAQNPLGGIDHALKNSLPPQFENGWAKKLPHVLQAQQLAYNDQPSGPSAIWGRSAANVINLDDDQSDVAQEPVSHAAALTPQAASLSAIHPQNQPARAMQPVDQEALSQWNVAKHGDPTKMDTFARRGGTAPMSVTNGLRKSASVGVSKDRRKKPAGVERVVSPQRAAQLTSVVDADLQENIAAGGAGLYAAPAAPGPAFWGEHFVQNWQSDRANFRSDDTVAPKQDDELDDLDLRAILERSLREPHLSQPGTSNSRPLGQMDEQYAPISGPQPSMPQSNLPGRHNNYTTETGQQLDPLLWAEFFDDDGSAYSA
ncbi:hypothetical protein AC578_6668 [Pseudocercospora eumusae]|uniref:Uncharacterized protein n=1 Tax=Pseudocercospora eumusae TaxID=321146 RepID=A0A139HI25_9PEZI|nr:hypothetical protein AC578_6668 [Pseudocercospora eumusae]